MKRVIFTLCVFLSIYCLNGADFLSQEILDSKDLESLAQRAQEDMLDSVFFKDISTPQVIALSDFANLTHFELDIQTLARLPLVSLRDSGKFSLTGAISGNALNADPLLDGIRAQRNKAEFQDIIPNGALLAPTYSLSARISDSLAPLDSGADSKNAQNPQKVRTNLSFIFSITNLKTGLIEWDYIAHISKEAQIEGYYKSQNERACLAGGNGASVK